MGYRDGSCDSATGAHGSAKLCYSIWRAGLRDDDEATAAARSLEGYSPAGLPNVLASYVHLHFRSQKDKRFARRLLQACRASGVQYQHRGFSTSAPTICSFAYSASLYECFDDGRGSFNADWNVTVGTCTQVPLNASDWIGPDGRGWQMSPNDEYNDLKNLSYVTRPARTDTLHTRLSLAPLAARAYTARAPRTLLHCDAASAQAYFYLPYLEQGRGP